MTKNKYMNKSYNLAMMALSLTMLSCSTENGYSEFERTQAYFLDKLNGAVSPSQWWKTSVTVYVKVETSAPTELWMISEDESTIFDYRKVEQNGDYAMTVPQGKGMTIKLVSICNRHKKYQTITLTGKNTEQVFLYVTEDNNRSANSQVVSKFPMAISSMEDDGPHCDPNVHYSLHGNSIVGGTEHYEFTIDQKLELVEMLKILTHEAVNAKTGHGLNCDYELESKGPFRITWLTGYEANQQSQILGYYYHSPNTYEDIEFHDLSDTQKYDIIDGFAKVQYQIRDTSYVAHPEYGILPNKWYDANFDMSDKFGSTSANNSNRIGDQAYNGMEVFRIFGTGVSRLRGISFPIDVPEGKHLGFYLKNDEVKKPEQWDALKKIGIKNIGARDNWKATNFCVEAFNDKKTHRSCILPYTHTIWMGMENVYTGGDFDCNDVIFGITTEIGIVQPSPVEPDINYIVSGLEKMPWTIAYEDVGREADFDFNDAVIKVVPDYEQETCCVTVEAAGSPYRMYLHYDGPDGDVNMGEIHELLGGKPGHKINTATSVPEEPFVEIDCVPWPKTYTMSEDAKRFWIEVERGTCTDCTDAITLAQTPGQLPEAMLIAGEWKWPMEEVHIFSAYNSFPQWAKDVSKTGYWNWYSNAKAGTTVSY